MTQKHKNTKTQRHETNLDYTGHDAEDNMATLTYNNTNNGGKERVSVDNGKYYISSNIGRGWYTAVRVSRADMIACLRHTNAPADVVAAILEAE